MSASRPYIRVPYDRVDWVWVSAHYDLHFEGLARHNGQLMRFQTPQFYWYTRRSLRPQVRLFRLSVREKLRWLARKWWFEFCVGRHWTYPDRKLGQYVPPPKWRTDLYYRLQRG
ncbi:MAG TPA: hypothetical protein VFS24_11710 [Steroidobacteraceae bacterium]|nr:hypothetical protein [Steroidobacteraceae bacterium]